MSYNLDLRSPDYKSRLNYHKYRPLKIALTVLFIILPVLFSQGLSHYNNHLVHQVESLEKELSAIRLDADPLIIMNEELDNFAARNILKMELAPHREKWSAGLKLIRNTVPSGITLSTIDIRSGGFVQIYGTSVNIQKPAQFQLEIEGLAISKNSELKTIAMNEDHSYSFQIETRLLKGDDLEADGKNDSDY